MLTPLFVRENGGGSALDGWFKFGQGSIRKVNKLAVLLYPIHLRGLVYSIVE
jgi:hypothetical protein